MKKQNRDFLGSVLVVVLLVLFAVFCHSIARKLEAPEISRFLNFIRTSIYFGLFSVWGISVKRRVVQPQVRRYLVAVSVLMLFWLILREVKYRFVIDPDIERYLWYLYYIPILLIPLIALFVSILLGANETYRLPKMFLLFYFPPTALISLFITNDLHQLAFRFPQDATVWTEHGGYSYGIVFYLAIMWGVSCSLAAMIIMLSKSHLPRQRGQFWLPLAPIAIVLMYIVCYTLRLPIIGELDDIAAFVSLIFISFFEICIRLGLIPSNTRYSDLFRASRDSSMQIVDDNYTVRYAASAAEYFDKAELICAEKHPVVTNSKKRLHNMPIRGGHAVWTEDISELLQQTQALREAQAELNDRSEIVQMEYEQEKDRRIVEEQNRLLDLLQSATQRQLDKVKELTEEYQASQDENEKRKLIAKIVVLGSFIKRRKDFLLSLEGSPTLNEGKLISAFDESFRSLRLYGISGGYAVHTGKTAINGKVFTLAYDFFEDVLESVIDTARNLNVSVAPAAGILRCSVMADCEVDIFYLSKKHPTIQAKCGNGETQLLLPLEGGNDR